MKLIQQKIIQSKHLLNVYLHQFSGNLKLNGFKYLIIIFAGLIISTKDVDFQLKLTKNETNQKTNHTDSLIQKISFSEKEQPPKPQLIKYTSEKEKRFLSYIDKNHKLAIIEMKKYKIPASVTLAQGILETNGGKSKLATNCNNHFGIKCFSKKCKKGHCKNFSDDSHKDFFRNYSSTKESYRAHSIFLQKNRYKKLFNYNSKDYKSWCYELKNAGYATDPNYPNKLISIIEKYKLYQFDE